MPFAVSRRHQYWTADVRYIDDHKLGGRAYVISVLENHSRAIPASAVTRTQDLASYLSVLYAAVERYGSPEVLVTDGGGIFRARQAKAVYEALRIRTGWLKALKLEGYAPRRPRGPMALQQALFPYAAAI